MRTSHLLASMFAMTGLTTGCMTPEDSVQKVADRDDLTVVVKHAHITDGLSDELVVTAPEGLQSVLMEVRGDKGLYYLTKFQTPSGDLIEGARYMTRFAREVPGLVDWLYPNTPTLAMEPGEYKILLRGETRDGGKVNEDIEIRFYTKAKTAIETCGIHLDFLVDKQAIDSADFEAALDRAVIWVNNLYAPMGIRVLDYQVTQITLPNTQFDPDSTATVTGQIDNVLEQARHSNTARTDAVHVVVVRKIGGSDPAGYAMGLPGPFDADRSNAAVLVSTDAYTTDGFLDVEGLSSTIAHEVGHYLGLYHTSESNGAQHDPLPDTPECDGAVCTPSFENNIMTAGGGANRLTVTANQAFVMRQHPLCQPADFGPTHEATCSSECSAPSTCSVIDGDAQCRNACDPDAPTCGSGTCSPDDHGTFVCVP